MDIGSSMVIVQHDDRQHNRRRYHKHDAIEICACVVYQVLFARCSGLLLLCLQNVLNFHSQSSSPSCHRRYHQARLCGPCPNTKSYKYRTRVCMCIRVIDAQNGCVRVFVCVSLCSWHDINRVYVYFFARNSSKSKWWPSHQIHAIRIVTLLLFFGCVSDLIFWPLRRSQPLSDVWEYDEK